MKLSDFLSLAGLWPSLRRCCAAFAQQDLTADDISFLRGETGIDAALLTQLAESAHRNAQASKIPQSAFYDLLRQGFPTVLEGLLKNEIPVLRAALESSSNEAIIPQLSSAQLDQIADDLRILKGQPVAANRRRHSVTR